MLSRQSIASKEIVCLSESRISGDEVVTIDCAATVEFVTQRPAKRPTTTFETARKVPVTRDTLGHSEAVIQMFLIDTCVMQKFCVVINFISLLSA